MFHSPVNVVFRDTKRLGHVGQSQTTVGLQELRVGEDPHLTDIVTVVSRQITILPHSLLNFGQVDEEVCILAVVEREEVLFDIRHPVKHF